MGAKPSELITRIYQSLDRAPEGVRGVIQNFMRETRDELWPSEEELVESLRQAGLPEGGDPRSAQVLDLAQPQTAARRRVPARPRR